MILHAVLLTAVAAQGLVQKTEGGVRYQQVASPIPRGQGDMREYAALVLDNHMKVLLVSDRNAYTGSAAMVVSTGSRDDPPYMLGLAHLVEHIVAGPDKARCEDEDYTDLVHTYGGSENAMTKYDHTTYSFSVLPFGLNATLLHFAKLFKAASIPAGRAEHEAHVVHSEYLEKKQNRGNKIGEVKKVVMDQTHPYARFAMGSLKTLVTVPKGLGKKLDEEAIRFIRERYTANNMQLVVVAREPLATLTRYAVAYFSDIPQRELPTVAAGMPFTNVASKVDVFFPKVKDYVVLDFAVSIPASPLSQAILESLVKYINDGVPGTGLATEGRWRTEIVAYLKVFRDFSTFELQIHMDHGDVMKRDTVVAEAIAELQALDLTKFTRFVLGAIQPQDYPRDLAEALAVRLHLGFPFAATATQEDVVRAATQQQIKRILGLITQANMKTFLITQDSTRHTTEPWLGADYRLRVLPESYRPLSLHLGKPQAKPQAMRPAVAPKSSLVGFKEKVTVWKEDGQQTTGKIDIKIHLCVPNQFALYFTKAKMSLFLTTFQDQTKGIAASWSLAVEKGCFVASFHLPKENAFLLPLHFVNGFRSELSENTFHKLMTEASAEWDVHFSEPYTQAFEAMEYALNPDAQKPRILVQQELTPAQVRDYLGRLIANKVAVYFRGELAGTANELADTFHRLITKDFPVATVSPPVKAKFAGEFVLNSPAGVPSDPQNAISYFLHTFEANQPKQQIMSQLLNFVMYQCFFHQLRVNEYLGYKVGMYNVYLKHGGGLLFSVNSPKHPIHLESRINGFLSDFHTTLTRMPAKDFEKKLVAFKQLIQYTNGYDPSLYRDWRKDPSPTKFNRDVMLHHLDSLTLAQLMEFYQRTLLPTSKQRAKLSIHVTTEVSLAKPPSVLPLASCGQAIDDLSAWKTKYIG